jgi:maltose alpha-D-glucosyltransferase / alpha-amylase
VTTKRPIPSDGPLWFKDAIIYEVRVRSFYDSNGDGIGDFRGMTEKLDYLQDLGVTALWLLPFYPSPLRDDGYDIADYTDVHPDCGTLADFEQLIEEAHRRGLKIITELVLNHTSDQHPWFRRARRAPAGSVERDFYVWSDSMDRYKDARIIFQDFEPSNWSWDPVARAYFWHRFYAHQPDLNFASPAVQEALLGAVDFWLAKGVDGLRLDAVPYLYEKEGTTCENLPETHVFIKKLRAHIDSKFKDRMLLAEANQWPEDAVAYFGDGDECHMNFHFPLMPRMFMSIHMEDRLPILDILAQTPPIPATCQWALFLRNHDELTLEMVTDEERDYMYRAYAHDREMRINLGIRRRLAPLVGNDRRKMELLVALLFSLPGTPVLYYGDEIGMGDNVFLGDRDGVRTPMQWSSDRNAGFSRTNPQRLILPIVIDPEYHYEAINVEAYQNNPNSLLWWTKRLIVLRKQFQAFGRGSMDFLAPLNHRVLAFVRQFEDQVVLVVANLARSPQYVELDLAKWKGMRPVELQGGAEFPPIGDLPYLLTLGGHAFYWFSIETRATTAADERAAGYTPPILIGGSTASLLRGDERRALEEALPAFLETRRWFGERATRVSDLRIEEAVTFDSLEILVVRVDSADRDSERYVLPLALIADAASAVPTAVVATLRTPAGDVALVDATTDLNAARALLRVFISRTHARGLGGTVEATPYAELEAFDGEPANISHHHSSATLRYGDRYLLKIFRRMEEGISPELDVHRLLAARAPQLTPAVVGALEYRRGRGDPSTLAVLQSFVANEDTAWVHAREEVRRYYERALTRHRDETPPHPGAASFVDLAHTTVEPLAREVIGPYLDQASLLGRRTAEMHLALASEHEDPAFAPEPYTNLESRSKYQSMRNLVGRTLRLLRANLARLPDVASVPARKILEAPTKLLQSAEPFLQRRVSGKRIRIHGDYHLEQVLVRGNDYTIVDFDGPRSQSLAERRRKHSALRDVASMMRSFHYAAFSSWLESAVVRPEDRAVGAPWAGLWANTMAATFLRAYLDTVKDAPFMPTEIDLPLLLEMNLLGQALHELRDELDRAGDTAAISLLGIIELVRL